VWSDLAKHIEIIAELPELRILFDEERRISKGY
jgi:hypothetical protein